MEKELIEMQGRLCQTIITCTRLLLHRSLLMTLLVNEGSEQSGQSLPKVETHHKHRKAQKEYVTMPPILA